MEYSETSSVTQSIDYEADSVDACSWVTEPISLIDVEQRAPLGTKTCERQLRYDSEFFLVYVRNFLLQAIACATLSEALALFWNISGE